MRQAVVNLPTYARQFLVGGIGVVTFLIFELVRRVRPAWPEALVGLAVLPRRQLDPDTTTIKPGIVMSLATIKNQQSVVRY